MKAKPPEPGDTYGRLIGSHGRKLETGSRPSEFVREFRKLPPEVGHLIAAEWCQSEVCNGGFAQFFTDSTGILAPEALKAFRAIGLVEWAKILEEAMRFFGRSYPRDQKTRINKFSAVSVPGQRRKYWDPFRPLDDRFFAWLHAEPRRFVRAADKYAEQFL